MGLRNNALHVMLANGRVAPFYIREPPLDQIRWTIIDHLITIYKIKESDYVEEQPVYSINNMAIRLCNIYAHECERTRYLVLVRDGSGAKKPAVYRQRKSQPTARHIIFYKQHALLIEYAVLRMLYERGFGDRVFFITGADMSFTNHSATFISLHGKSAAGVTETTLLDNISSALEKKDTLFGNTKPPGEHGVFMYTYADCNTSGYLDMRLACLQCLGVEADTVMIELAANLQESKVVCTRDTDVVAILTAIGDTDTIVRLDNLSYRYNKSMFLTPSFYTSLVCNGWSVREPLNFQTETDRLYTLCDVESGCLTLPRDVPALHACWEVVITEKTTSIEHAARLLYQNGIRGALYVDLLRLIFGLPEVADTIALATHICLLLQSCHSSDQALFQELFNAVPRGTLVDAVLNASYEDRQLRCYAILCTLKPGPLCDIVDLYDENSASKRQRIDVQSIHNDYVDDDNGGESTAPDSIKHTPSHVKITEKELLSRYRVLRRMYKENSIPEHTYARYLLLCNVGPYFYLSKKRCLMTKPEKRNIKLMFMILSGTDYTFTLPGLGGNRILTTVIMQRGFGRWCLDLIRIWEEGSATSAAIYDHAVRLARLAGLSANKIKQTWTLETTNKCIRSMEYAYKLWTLQQPIYGPEYYQYDN